MCMADGGDDCDVFHSFTRKAAKDHFCGECRRVIAKGENYRLAKWLYDGVWSDGRICAHCCVLADWLVEECGGYLIDGVVEDFGEHAAEYGRFDLQRLRWGARNEWRRHGQLLPIPKVPLTSTAREAASRGEAHPTLETAR